LPGSSVACRGPNSNFPLHDARYVGEHVMANAHRTRRDRHTLGILFVKPNSLSMVPRSSEKSTPSLRKGTTRTILRRTKARGALQ
jgi:hypothetical protein